MRRRSCVSVGCSLLVCVLVFACGSVAHGAGTRVGTFSSSQRFYVTGSLSEQTVYFSTWAEDVADRLSELLDGPIPFRRGESLHISLRENPLVPKGRVWAEQQFADTGLRQTMVLVNVDAVDQERALEVLCSLFLSRLLIARLEVESFSEVPVAPRWLAVGLAQLLYSELRVRNNDLAFDTWQSLDGIRFEEFLDGRYDEESAQGRTLAAAACAWLESMSEGGVVWNELLDHIASGQPLTSEWLEHDALALVERGYLERSWALWMASRSMVESRWGVAGSRDVEKLERLLVVPSAIVSLVAGETHGSDMSLEGMIQYRQEPWVGGVARYLALKMYGLGIGRSPEYRAVAESYAHYLNALLVPEPRGFLGRWFGRGVSDAELLGLLQAANKELMDLKEQAR